MAVQSRSRRFRAIISCSRMGISSSSCRKKGAPGMPGNRSGRGKRISIPARSASRIAHPGHDGGLLPILIAQIAAVIALCQDIAGAGAFLRTVFLPIPMSHRCARLIGGELPWDRLSEVGLGAYATPVPIQDGRFFMRGEGRGAHRGLAGTFRAFRL